MPRAFSLLLLAWTLLAGQVALAQAEPRWALVVGNQAYRHVDPLGTPVADARAVAATLAKLGFAVTRHENLDRRGMNRAVRDFADRVAGGVAFVYYAGHGVQTRTGNYLLPVDIDPKDERDVEDDAVRLDDALRSLAGAKARLVVVFLDACRNNPLPQPAARGDPGRRGLAQPATPNGTMIVYSAGVNEQALDSLPGETGAANGLFVRELLPELERPGAALDSAVKTARERVRAKARAARHEQNPAIYDQLEGGPFLLSLAPPGPGPGSVPAAGFDPRQLDLEFWTSVKDSREAEDLQAYLDRFGDQGEFAPLARRRLAALRSAAPQAPSAPPASPLGLAAGAHDDDPASRPGKVFRDCAGCPAMVVVPAGTFTMGSPAGEEGRDADEGPQHEVVIAEPFALGRHEVTFDEWHACIDGGGCGGHRPGDAGWGRGTRPVINVSWNDAQAYVRWLSAETGERYRLPSEAEWEYAARAGTATPFWTGGTISAAQANYDGGYAYGRGVKGEFRQRTVPIEAAGFPANPFGLRHVHGNLWEWVEDCYRPDYAHAARDGGAWSPAECPERVLRGGAWASNPKNLRSAVRVRYSPAGRNTYRGFRVARTLTP